MVDKSLCLLSVLLKVRFRYRKTWGSPTIFSVARKQVVQKHTAFEDAKTEMCSFGAATSRNRAITCSKFSSMHSMFSLAKSNTYFVLN